MKMWIVQIFALFCFIYVGVEASLYFAFKLRIKRLYRDLNTCPFELGDERRMVCLVHYSAEKWRTSLRICLKWLLWR